jgi:hypothetical protein
MLSRCRILSIFNADADESVESYMSGSRDSHCSPIFIALQEVHSYFQCPSIAHYSMYFPAAEFLAPAMPTMTRECSAWNVAAAGFFCGDGHSAGEEDVHSGAADECAGRASGRNWRQTVSGEDGWRRCRRRGRACCPDVAVSGACGASMGTSALQTSGAEHDPMGPADPD